MTSPTAGGAGLSPPPKERLHERVRRQWRSLKRHSGLRWWLLVQGTPIVVTFIALFVVNGCVIGWRQAYDVMLGITSPAEAHHFRLLAWVLSIAGWLLGPAIAGAVVGVVITGSITSRRTRRFTDLLDGVDLDRGSIDGGSVGGGNVDEGSVGGGNVGGGSVGGGSVGGGNVGGGNVGGADDE